LSLSLFLVFVLVALFFPVLLHESLDHVRDGWHAVFLLDFVPDHHNRIFETGSSCIIFFLVLKIGVVVVVIDEVKSYTILLLVAVCIKEDFSFNRVDHGVKVEPAAGNFFDLFDRDTENADSVFAAIVCVDLIFHHK